MIKKSDKIFVAGHKGLIGSAIVRKLKLKGYKNIIRKFYYVYNIQIFNNKIYHRPINLIATCFV